MDKEKSDRLRSMLREAVTVNNEDRNVRSRNYIVKRRTKRTYKKT